MIHFVQTIKVCINRILLIFKLHVYKSREKTFNNIINLTGEIRKIKSISKVIALNNSKKTIAFTKNET